MRQIPELITRLEQATGPNYQLEVDIFKLLHPEYAEYVQGRGGLIHPCDGQDVRVPADVRAPNYTASVDAALALAERCFPGAWYHLAKGKTRAAEPLYGAALMFGEKPIGQGESDGSAALAVCIAVLKAKLASPIPHPEKKAGE